VGTPTEDGGAVVAAQTFTALHKIRGVYLLNAATGAILGFIQTGSPMFGQAVFTRSDMIIGAGGSFGMQAFHVAPAGPPITQVAPNIIAPGATTRVELTGRGFSGRPAVNVSGGPVTVKSVTVVSSTAIKVSVFVAKSALPGTYDVSVTEPGPVVDSCTSCLTIGTSPPGRPDVAP
jgi:hypothetical protein